MLDCECCQLVHTYFVTNHWSKWSQYKVYGIIIILNRSGVWAKARTSIQWLLMCTCQPIGLAELVCIYMAKLVFHCTQYWFVAALVCGQTNGVLFRSIQYTGAASVRPKYTVRHGRKSTSSVSSPLDLHLDWIYIEKLLNEGFCVVKRFIYLQFAVYNYVYSFATPLIYIDKLNKHWHLFPSNICITRALDVNFFPWFAVCFSLTVGDARYCESLELLCGQLAWQYNNNNDF